MERQEKNRYRFWAPIKQLEGRFLRVITLEDNRTTHNVFPDPAMTYNRLQQAPGRVRRPLLYCVVPLRGFHPH